MNSIKATGLLIPLVIPLVILLATVPLLTNATELAVITPAQTDSGKQLYQQFCQRCHGTEMRNSGASTFDLRQFPADEYDRFIESVSEGYEDMPAHGDILSGSEIDALFAYMVTIQNANQKGNNP